MKDFVKAEIDSANEEIRDALDYNPKLFRVPMLMKHPDIWKAAEGLTIVWGKVVDTSGCLLAVTKDTALTTLRNWNKDEPCVLIFHDIRPVTYENIGEILDCLQEDGFALVDFDPTKIPDQVGAPDYMKRPRQPLSVIARCPVDLVVTDPEGLVLSKEQNQIPNAIYKEIDVDEDGDLDDFFVIPEPKAGHYSVQVIPEPNALADDTYSLELTYGERVIVLADKVPIREVPSEPYSVTVIQEADLNGDEMVNLADFAILAEHWRLLDYCNPTNNWCSGADIDRNGSVDFCDMILFSNDWLSGMGN